MKVLELNILIPIANSKSLTLSISTASDNALFAIDLNEALLNGEAPHQIKEGCYYNFKIDTGYTLSDTYGIVSANNYSQFVGIISPNIYVGTLTLDVLDLSTNIKCAEVKLEVQSIKTSYREDYRHMLEEITEKCTDLLLQHSSPVTQSMEVDYKDSTTLYQKFAFIKSILDSSEFNDAIHKIIYAPVTKWADAEIDKDIRGVKRLNNKALRQIASGTNRIALPKQLQQNLGLESVPSKININYKKETVDTPENRFIKYALTSFLNFVSLIKTKTKKGDKINQESIALESQLEQVLTHSIFKDISNPTTLPLNSPVLQRKEGYREVLKVWLMFDLASKLVWHGGDDVYSAGKRDVAVLYEYWLFFKLLDIIKDVFNIEPKDIKELIKPTGDGLGLQLKQGKHIPLKGVYLNDNRKLNVEFSYNRTFSGKKDYPNSGSWTKDMRPDYTLSIWPFGIGQIQAEKEELIVHIHFDAKYKVENLAAIIGDTTPSLEQTEDEIQEQLNEEKEDQRKGKFKRIDLLKMHSYKDAIRRTGGAYILYPGDESYMREGFHEILPGLGAFPVKPSKTNTGEIELKRFINDVVYHFLNRNSQREKTAFRTYDIHKDNIIGEVRELLPESYGTNRAFLPDDTFVLIGYYKNEEHLDWILKNSLYNFRTGTDRGSLPLSAKEMGASYIVLHGPNETKTAKIYKLKEEGPRIFSKQDLLNKKYKSPNGDLYLVYKLDDVKIPELENQAWDITKLDNYSGFRNSAKPISVSFTELMNVVLG
jgi:predicted component of viral defense system (DUF524 family)